LEHSPTGGALADRPVEDLADTGLVDGVGHARPCGFIGQPAQLGHVVEVLRYQELVVQGVRLGQIPDAALRGRQIVGDRSAIEAYHTLVGLKRARDHLHRRGLPGPVGAQEPDHLASLHLETQTVHGNHLTVALGYSFNRDHRTPIRESHVGPRLDVALARMAVVGRRRPVERGSTDFFRPRF
jgi:hypothetical protein